MGNICLESGVERLEIISSFDEALERNMTNHKEAIPEKRYAMRVYDCPVLTQTTIKIREMELQRQNFVEEKYRGVELPPFIIHRKQLYYQGEWRNRIPHGKGKIYFPGGHYFEGYFNQGQANSKNGLLIFNDGSYYRGEVQFSTLSGKGRFTSSSGMVYEGAWINNKPEGYGKQTFSDKNQYEGYFVEGLKQGEGVFKWADGKVYQGTFAKGKMNGEGKLSRGTTELFVGKFQNNKKIGNGKLKTAFGEYTGLFEDGKFSGKGKFVWNDNKVYEGEFKEGKMDGRGVLTFPNGQLIKGVWEKGQHIELLEIKKGKSLSHSKS